MSPFLVEHGWNLDSYRRSNMGEEIVGCHGEKKPRAVCCSAQHRDQFSNLQIVYMILYGCSVLKSVQIDYTQQVFMMLHLLVEWYVLFYRT
jgi:hypothetical protein